MFAIIKKFLPTILFAIRAAAAFFRAADKDGIADQIKTVTDTVDSIAKDLPKKATEELIGDINKDEVEYKGLTATLQPDKHGKGNHGIEIGFDDGHTKITYDPTTGKVDGEIKIQF